MMLATTTANLGEPVTASKTEPWDRFAIRNARPVSRAEEARRHGRCCGQCGRDLEPGEPVWLSISKTFGNVRCADCAARILGVYAFRDTICATCRRAIHTTWWHHHNDYCCRDCAWARKAEQQRAAQAARRTARAEARAGLKCEQCGELLDASRKDARYCKNACRQKAYRQRRHPTDQTVV